MLSPTRKIVMTGLFAALAYAVLIALPIPIQFLTLDFKDVVIAIAGFILGPLAACAIALIVAGVEMLTISATGPIGFVMNVVATLAFVIPAILVYRSKPSIGSVVLGVVLGGITMVLVMLVWNYWLTPLYLGVPRAMVRTLIYTLILPFNLLKATLSGLLLIILYRPFNRVSRAVGFTDHADI
jgi:riboflavin transporter FmnP